MATTIIAKNVNDVSSLKVGAMVGVAIVGSVIVTGVIVAGAVVAGVVVVLG